MHRINIDPVYKGLRRLLSPENRLFSGSSMVKLFVWCMVYPIVLGNPIYVGAHPFFSVNPIVGGLNPNSDIFTSLSSNLDHSAAVERSFHRTCALPRRGKAQREQFVAQRPSTGAVSSSLWRQGLFHDASEASKTG